MYDKIQKNWFTEWFYVKSNVKCLWEFSWKPYTIHKQFLYRREIVCHKYQILKHSGTKPLHRRVFCWRGPWTVSAVVTLQGQTLNIYRSLSSSATSCLSLKHLHICPRRHAHMASLNAPSHTHSWCCLVVGVKSLFQTKSSSWWMDWGWIRRPEPSPPHFPLNRYKLGMKSLLLCHHHGSTSASLFLFRTVESIACNFFAGSFFNVAPPSGQEWT